MDMNNNIIINNNNDDDNEETGPLWELLKIKSKEFGKLGPAFGIGAGCGVGLSFGLIGGAGFGHGIPGMQLGFGVGAGCGIGVGFGYGLGKGIAYDDKKKYSNIKKPAGVSNALPIENDIGALFEELVINSKKLLKATSKEIEKWSR